MKKLIFSILPAFLFAFISCMNMSSGSGENGSVRVALPGSGRATYAYSKNNADKFIVRLYNDGFDQTEDGTVGGVIEFGDLEPGKYTATAEAWNLGENILEGSGSTEITVRAGETTDCNITMILEGQTAYYSKYMLFSDSDDNMYAYDYLTCTEKKRWKDSYNLAEDNSGSVYSVYSPTDSQGYYITPTIRIFSDTDSEKCSLQFASDHTDVFDAYYDSTTDIYWLANDVLSGAGQTLYLYNENNKYTGITKTVGQFPFSCACIATQGEKFYYSFVSSDDSLHCPDSIGYATFDYTTSGGSANEIETKTLADFGVSGTITDMAVLEDGTVAVLVNEKSLNPANQFTLNDGCTVYSRGALVLLSSDLSTYKVYGWTDSPRTIRATEDTENPVKEWTSITAYIPDYAERNSHFYGPMRIVAIRPKELVIADCGANFVLADYKKHRQGKMFTHNRLMTVNLRNFAIGCKKEFSEDELKFQNLSISGNIEVSTSGDWSNKYVDEK